MRKIFTILETRDTLFDMKQITSYGNPSGTQIRGYYFRHNDIKENIYEFENTIGSNERFCPIYEIPTKELCNVLSCLIKFSKATKVREVGAGSGLLTALLQPILNVEIKATDGNKDISNIDTYTKVSYERFNDIVIEPGEDILISWLHSDV